MPTALVIGASRGIGREFVTQLLAKGYQVTATARDESALAALRAVGAETVKVDVTSAESLAGLGWKLDDARLDLALYVAGVYGPSQGASAIPTARDFDTVMHANVLGAMQVIPLVAPLVEAADGRFAFISSGMGSIADAGSSDGWIYRASKAALNMAVKSASHAYPKSTMLVLSPGWVRTDMGGGSAPLSVEDSVAGMLTVLSAASRADSGKFISHTGKLLAW